MEDVLVIRKLLRVEIAEDPTRVAIRVVTAPAVLTAPVIPCVVIGDDQLQISDLLHSSHSLHVVDNE
jgi:hypothetical protein